VPNNNNKSNTGERTEITHVNKYESTGSTAVKSLQSTSTRVFLVLPVISLGIRVMTSARVQACALGDVSCAAPVKASANETARGAGQVRAGASVWPTAARCSRSEGVDSVDGGDLVVMFDDAGETRVKHAEDGVRQESPGIVAGEARTSEKGTGRDVSSSSSIRSRVLYSSKVANDANEPVDGYGGVCHTSVINERPMYSQLIVDKLAPLQYVRISIDGLDGDFVALLDSGSQINLIRRSLLPDDQQQSVGKIGIRGAFGAPIQTEVVMLAIKPAVHECYRLILRWLVKLYLQFMKS
jgi:hypothetical protein